MKTILPHVLPAALLAAIPLPSIAAEPPVQPVVESVSMFKNGVALVTASLADAPAGDLVWSDPPTAVHGTFFMEGPQGMTVRSTTRQIPVTRESLTGNLLNDLAGARVAVSLSSRTGALGQTLTGTVWQPDEDQTRQWSRSYQGVDGDGYGSYQSRWNSNNAANRLAPAPVAGPFLILEVDGQRTYLAASEIAQVKVEAKAERKVERPVFILNLPAPGKVRISYLTKGMAWIPSYQVELAGEKLRLRQSAVVKNELMNLKDAELKLISGFPSIRFAHVDAPLTPGVSLAAFFAQSTQQPGQQGGHLAQNMMYNNSRLSEGQPVLPPPEAGQGTTDIHYESIGKRELAAGDALSLDVAAGDAAMERVVEWTVPDQRDPWGRLKQQPGTRTSSDEDEPWDAVQFLNPFKMPMTTAAASIMEDGQFRGQSMTGWTAPGQQVCLRITKALTIYTQAAEHEEEGARDVVWVGGNDFRRTNVAGELTLRNDRAKPAKVVIRLEFSGNLLEAEGNPAKSLRADGASGVNPLRKLEWTVNLPAAAEQKLKYRYSLLVDN